MKKKIILFSLLASLIIGMTACNNENSVPEVTEQTTSIIKTVTEKKTETTEITKQAENTLTVNDETQITVKEENTMADVTAEISEEITSENESEEFSFENLTINIFGEEHTLPIYVKDIKTEGWYLEQAELENQRYENGFYILTGGLNKDDANKSIFMMVTSEDKILSDNDRITLLMFSFIGDWSLGKIKRGVSREYVNNVYNNFSTIDDGSDYYEKDNKILYISYDKFDNVSGLTIKGI